MVSADAICDYTIGAWMNVGYVLCLGWFIIAGSHIVKGNDGIAAGFVVLALLSALLGAFQI